MCLCFSPLTLNAGLPSFARRALFGLDLGSHPLFSYRLKRVSPLVLDIPPRGKVLGSPLRKSASPLFGLREEEAPSSYFWFAKSHLSRTEAILFPSIYISSSLFFC